jgi:Carboxypeptidase regulatory-like domain
MMRRHVLLIVTLLSLACGKEPTSPSSAQQWSSFPQQAPPGPPRTMRGEVWDTTNLPISGAQVQVVAPTRGTVAVTDENGQFLMPWPFTGTVTVRASKEGFHSREYSTPEPGAPRYPVSLGFELEAD